MLTLMVLGFLLIPQKSQAGIYVRIGPPAVIVETPPPPPGPAYVWIPGHWRWNGYKYVWVPGHYRHPPRPVAKWIPGRWVDGPHGWYWIEGHWRYLVTAGDSSVVAVKRLAGNSLRRISLRVFW